MGGVYAISFADFFYKEDGSSGIGAWILKGIALCIGVYGIFSFRKKQNQCAIDTKSKRKNFILLIIHFFSANKVFSIFMASTTHRA